MNELELKRKIVDMLDNIENTGTLEYLYIFIRLFLEKWG